MKKINWKNAKKIIPGGNSFFSKRAELYLSGLWPSYFTKSKGCNVYDIKNKKYIDMIMGIGTNILGYSNNKINKKIKNIIDKGIMSTLNAPEEYLLAEKMLKINKWADQVKFARGGGEANAIAIRIARAYSKKDNVAFCGYHGWHDWYLSANLNNKNNLNKHLLKGIKISGVPNNLKNTAFPFEYNKIEQLENIINKKKIAAVKMEVVRNLQPKHNFLNKVQKLCKKKKIVLIFDECTSGFRQTFGGIHKFYGVEPDIAIYGKSLGNGHPISAIVGKSQIMKLANSSFISSTFWSERVGFVAALSTLEIMEKEKSWNYITKLGLKIRSKWEELAKKNLIKINISGIPAISSFSFDQNNDLYKTLITQEMFKGGYIANNSVYVSTAHNQKILKNYYKIIDNCFSLIKKHELKKIDIKKILKSKTSLNTFKRLN